MKTFFLLVGRLPKQQRFPCVEPMHLEVYYFLLKQGQIQCLCFRFAKPVHGETKDICIDKCAVFIYSITYCKQKQVYVIVHTGNNTKSWCFWRAGFFLKTELFPEFSYEMIHVWNEYNYIYCIKINLIYELNILRDSSFSSCVSILCSSTGRRGIAREKVLLFPLWTQCHPVFSEMLLTVALGCRCGSGCAIFSPSSPVIGPDGCKAALLQNMSRAGEEEVGVESGKGQRPKTSPSTSSRCHTLWHPRHAAGTFKPVVKPPPTKRANLLWNVFVYF